MTEAVCQEQSRCALGIHDQTNVLCLCCTRAVLVLCSCCACVCWTCHRSSEQEEQMARLLNPDLVLPTLLSWQDVKGVTPLMLAGRGGHADCMKLLLQHGADPLLLDGINRRYARVR